MYFLFRKYKTAKERRKKMMELRFARYICAGETSSRDPNEGSQGSQDCNIHRKRPVLESLFNKVAEAFNLNKKRLQHKCFPVNTAKFLITAFFLEQLWWLLLQLLRKTVFLKVEIKSLRKSVKEFSFY